MQKKICKYSSRNRKKIPHKWHQMSFTVTVNLIFSYILICNYLLLLYNNKVEHLKKCFLALHVFSPSLFFFCFPYLLPIFQFDSPFLICRNSIHSLGTKTSLVFCSENIFSQFLSFSLFIGHFYEEKILKFSIFFTFLKLSKIITTQWLKTMPISHVTVLRSEVQAGWLGSLLQASQVKSKVFFSLGGLPSGDSGRESTSKMIWLVT